MISQSIPTSLAVNLRLTSIRGSYSCMRGSIASSYCFRWAVISTPPRSFGPAIIFLLFFFMPVLL